MAFGRFKGIIQSVQYGTSRVKRLLTDFEVIKQLLTSVGFAVSAPNIDRWKAFYLLVLINRVRSHGSCDFPCQFGICHEMKEVLCFQVTNQILCT
jgi:hypothetical protein